MTDFVSTDCPACGVVYGLPRKLYDVAQREKRNGKSRAFYCPNGHTWHYMGESDAEKALRRAQRAEQRIAEAHYERDAALRRESAAKGAITKMRKRAAAGTCPCCNRTFVHLQRHMKSKHPNYEPDVSRNVVAFEAKS